MTRTAAVIPNWEGRDWFAESHLAIDQGKIPSVREKVSTLLPAGQRRTLINEDAVPDAVLACVLHRIFLFGSEEDLRAVVRDPLRELLVFGRSGSRTLAWLERYGVRWDLLIMRNLGDYAAAREFKRGTVGELRAELEARIREQVLSQMTSRPALQSSLEVLCRAFDRGAGRAWILADRAGNKVCIAAWPDGAPTPEGQVPLADLAGPDINLSDLADHLDTSVELIAQAGLS